MRFQVIWIYSQAADMIYAKGLHVGGTYPTQSVVRYEDMYWEYLTRKVLQKQQQKRSGGWVGASCLPSKPRFMGLKKGKRHVEIYY